MSKIPTTVDKQIKILDKKGLIIESSLDCKNFLSNINYYRFSWYTKAFEDNNSFSKEISFEKIKAIYILDQKLRGLIFEAIERIEVAMRTKLVNSICLNLGTNNPKPKILRILKEPSQKKRNDEARQKNITKIKNNFVKMMEYNSKHTQTKSFKQYLSNDFKNLEAFLEKNKSTKKDIDIFLEKNKTIKKDFDIFLKSKKTTKKDPKQLKKFLKQKIKQENIPFWCFAEKMVFSDIEYLYNLLRSVKGEKLNKIASQIADCFLLKPSELNCFISSLRTIRNTVAHYDKLFNVKFTFVAKQNTKIELSENNYLINHYKIICYLLKYIHPNNSWKERFDQLMLDINNKTNLNKPVSSYYGFPDDYCKTPR